MNEIFNSFTKKEIFEYLNSGDVDKSGSLKKIGGFRKHFPKMYEEFINTKFPEELENLPFKQKLWHFLKDSYVIPTCKICGNDVNFLTRKGHWGYCIYCSGSCAMQDDAVKEKLDATKIERYGDRTYNNLEKQRQTIMSKDKSFWESHYKKSLKTRFEKNGGKYFSNETLEKIKKTNIERYGVDSFVKTKEYREIIKEKHDIIQQKQYETKSKNKSFNTSKLEDDFCDYLNGIGIGHIRQYKSDKYPFACDFYLPDYDLFIEIQGSWTHGTHPFDKNNQEDIDKLNLWESKNSNFYNQAIYVWTNLDVKKRNIANKNGLNYLEIFSDKIDVCKSMFEEYLEKFYNNGKLID